MIKLTYPPLTWIFRWNTVLNTRRSWTKVFTLPQRSSYTQTSLWTTTLNHKVSSWLAVSDNAKSCTCITCEGVFESRSQMFKHDKPVCGKTTREPMKPVDQVLINEAVPRDTVQKSESLSYTYMKLSIRFAPAEYLE